jgi:hypothetical protein
MIEPKLPEAPYNGLMPYSEEDAPFFFGREREREVIIANLIASRLTLLYGASGVGKSSVLRAGVAHHLHKQAYQNLAEQGTPESIVVVFSSWRDEPVAGLARQIQESVGRVLNEDMSKLVPPSHSLIQTLQSWTDRLHSDLLIILDQFEEYFLYHPQEDSEGTFAVELPQAVNQRDLRVNFLVSIREDSLAKLDRFKGQIPNLFDNYLRIEHLNREAARAAIEKPIEQYNRLRAMGGDQASIEPPLVEAVLDQVRTGQVLLGGTGRGVLGGAAGLSQSEARIEAPYLQLVMKDLWYEEVRAGPPVLRLETLKRLGGAETIVKTHLDATMRTFSAIEQDTAAQLFHYLVTPSGSKIAHSAADLAEYVKIPQAQATQVLDKLSGQEIRILRPLIPPTDQSGVTQYEIFHDILAQAILDWRMQYIQAQDKAAEIRKEVQRGRSLVKGWAISIIASLLALGIPIGALMIVWVLRRAKPRYSWKQAITVATTWIIVYYIVQMFAEAVFEVVIAALIPDTAGVLAAGFRLASWLFSGISGPVISGIVFWRFILDVPRG